MSRLYLRPLGLIWGEDADSAVAAGEAGRLAGGFAAFTTVELIERRGADVKRERRSYRDIAGSQDQSLTRSLSVIEESRRAILGLELTKPLIMGIVNVTPDSFSDGGISLNPRAAIAHGERLAAEGASIIDVGGESTRPGSEGIAAAVEGERVLPVIGALARLGHRVSVDTRKASLMREAIAAGAQMINDVSALRFDGTSLSTAVRLKCPVCLMHAQGDPKTMQVNPVYEEVALDVFDALEGFIQGAGRAGLARELIVADPGIGFGKSYRHNAEILRNVSLYHGLGVALMVGASRKGFIGALTGEPAGKARAAGSVGVALAAAAQGVQILRVHDVKETVQGLSGWLACVAPSSSKL